MKTSTCVIIATSAVCLGVGVSILFSWLADRERAHRAELASELSELQMLARKQDRVRTADSLNMALSTPDLEFFGLHGRVREMSDGERSVNFDHAGHWRDENSYTSPGGYTLRLERNKFGRIIAGVSSETMDGQPVEKLEYVWDGPRLTRVVCTGAENSYTIRYAYDSHNRLTSKTTLNKDASGESEIASTYTYHDFDSRGNWTRRTCRSAIKTVQYGGYYDDETGQYISNPEPVIESDEQEQQRKIRYYE